MRFKGLNRTHAVQVGGVEPHPCGSTPVASTNDPDTYRQTDLLKGVGTQEGVRATAAPADSAPLTDDSSSVHEPEKDASHEPEAQPDLPLRAPLVLASSSASPASRLPPPFLDAEFRARCGSAAIDLPTWYAAVLAAIADRPIAQSLKAFWLAAFERDIGPQLAAAGGVAIGPQVAAAGGAIGRELPLTRTELAEAKQIRDRIWLRCRHEPRCVSYDACLAAIAWARRDEQTTRPERSSTA
jgi:hypothetical protein